MQDPAERSLAELLESHVDRERYRALHWEGSFHEYLAIAEERPAVVRNAWQRLYDMIESHGVRAALTPGGAVRYGLFDDPFGGGRDAVYGLDGALAELVRILRAGAHGLGPERRVILLHGPVGSAKSTIARLLKRGLEEYSRSDAGALYTFDWHVDGEVVPSPMNQDPLFLVPREARAALEQRLNRRHRASYSLTIDGELDPVSRWYHDRLLAEHDGDWRRVVEHVRVRRFVLSERERVGIGTFQPKDEKN